MKTHDPIVAIIAEALPSFHPLVRDAQRLGAADPVLAASELVVMHCHHSTGWTDALIVASPSKAITHAVNVARFRATLDDLDRESEEP